MTKSKKVAVVILCWNGRKHLEEFLPSVIQHSDEAEVIIADNCSTDDSVAFVEKNFPSVTLMKFEKNFGFAAGYNKAISKVMNEYVLLLNQDVEVTENWLLPLIKILDENKKVAAVQPKIKSYLNRSQFEYAGAAGGYIDSFGYTFCRGRIFDFDEIDEGQYNDATEVFWASGACLLTRKSVYEKLGGLDADLFAHMEEIDLCWRMKNEGYQIMYCPDSTVYHLGGGSLPQGHPFKTYLNFRNNLAMVLKNMPRNSAIKVFLLRNILDDIAAFRSLITGHWRDFLAIVHAQVNVLLHFRKWTRKRKKISIGFAGLSGVYAGSIVWNYFLKGRKTFSSLKWNK